MECAIHRHRNNQLYIWLIIIFLIPTLCVTAEDFITAEWNYWLEFTIFVAVVAAVGMLFRIYGTEKPESACGAAAVLIFLTICAYLLSYNTLLRGLNMVLLGLAIPCADMVGIYDDTEINESLKNSESIGALWAYGAFEGYYKKNLDVEKWKNRKENFKKKHGIQLDIDRSILICPLSCDIRNWTLEDDVNIKYIDSLDPLEDDKGANMNRQYKLSVYKLVHADVYIVAEMPTSLGTLWAVRKKMNETVWNYHRDSFISVLKSLLKGSPCIVLEYDNKDAEVDEKLHLHDFLASKLKMYIRNKEKFM